MLQQQLPVQQRNEREVELMQQQLGGGKPALLLDLRSVASYRHMHAPVVPVPIKVKTCLI